jgi:hypothetical protein
MDLKRDFGLDIKKETDIFGTVAKRKEVLKKKIKSSKGHSYDKTSRYATTGYTRPNNNFFYITGVPPSVAKSWTTGSLKAGLNDRQNNSPTVRTMIALAEKYKGKLDGYVIPIESGRDDARISFDGFHLLVSSVVAKVLKNKYKPDEFSKLPSGYYRF